MTKRQKQIIRRQNLLSASIENAISLDYIAEVDRKLPCGLEVKTISINPKKNVAARMLAYDNQANGTYINVTECTMIDGVNLHYIIIN